MTAPVAGPAASTVSPNAATHRNPCRIIFLMSGLLPAGFPDVEHVLFSEACHPHDREKNERSIVTNERHLFCWRRCETVKHADKESGSGGKNVLTTPAGRYLPSSSEHEQASRSRTGASIGIPNHDRQVR